MREEEEVPWCVSVCKGVSSQDSRYDKKIYIKRPGYSIHACLRTSNKWETMLPADQNLFMHERSNKCKCLIKTKGNLFSFLILYKQNLDPPHHDSTTCSPHFNFSRVCVCFLMFLSLFNTFIFSLLWCILYLFAFYPVDILLSSHVMIFFRIQKSMRGGKY